MSFPVTDPVLTQKQSIDVISEAEAGISQCLADFLCNEIFPNITALTDTDVKVELTKSILCSYTCKEKSIAAIMNGLSKKILADKGIVPGGDTGNICNCDC